MITVREAEIRDLAVVQQLVEKSFMEQMVFGITVAHEKPEQVEKDLVHNKVFLAFIDGIPVGTVRLAIFKAGVNKKKGYIKRLAVIPEYRGLGVGRRLIGAAEKFLYEKGITCINLVTADIIKYLDKFYLNLGYKCIGHYKAKGYPFGLKFWEKTWSYSAISREKKLNKKYSTGSQKNGTASQAYLLLIFL